VERKDLIDKVIKLGRRVRLAMDEMEPSPWLRLNLTRGQLRVVFLLSTKGKMSPGAVAAALGVPKANVTGIIDRLVRLALVSREHKPDDRRSYALCLTEKGRTEVERLMEWNIARLGKLLGRMTEAELDSLARGLEAMLRAAERKGDNYGDS
jgi:DNA-binding MarR family transcriptional regulator